jgi:hypothetical protein
MVLHELSITLPRLPIDPSILVEDFDANWPIYPGGRFGCQVTHLSWGKIWKQATQRFSMWHDTQVTLGGSHHFSSLPLNTITMSLLIVLIKCRITRFHIICNFSTCHDHIMICYQLNKSCMSLCNMHLVIHVRNKTFACIWCHHKLIIGLMWILFHFWVFFLFFLVVWKKLGVVSIIIWCELEHVGESTLRCNTFWHIWSSYLCWNKSSYIL